jgi:hypothetical protein
MAITVTSALAQSPAPNTSLPPPQFLLCKVIQDNAMRLACYDAAVSATVSQPAGPPAKKDRSWEITEQTEGRPSITAILRGANGSAELVVGCKENRTSVSVRFLTGLNTQNRVVHQVEKGKDVEEQWAASADGRSISPVKPIGFVRTFTDNGILSIQVFADADVLASESFDLGDVSGVRSKLMSGCIWPDPTVTAQKRIPLPKSSPIRSSQAEADKDGGFPAWLSKILKDSGEIN